VTRSASPILGTHLSYRSDVPALRLRRLQFVSVLLPFLRVEMSGSPLSRKPSVIPISFKKENHKELLHSHVVHNNCNVVYKE
jgi:hypothetical protein